MTQLTHKSTIWPFEIEVPTRGVRSYIIFRSRTDSRLDRKSRDHAEIDLLKSRL